MKKKLGVSDALPVQSLVKISNASQSASGPVTKLTLKQKNVLVMLLIEQFWMKIIELVYTVKKIQFLSMGSVKSAPELALFGVESTAVHVTQKASFEISTFD